MWLLNFHAAFSILCFITFMGFKIICKQALIDNGWVGNGKKASVIVLFMMCFIPLMNVITVLLLFAMIFMKKSDYDEIVKNAKKDG